MPVTAEVSGVAIERTPVRVWLAAIVRTPLRVWLAACESFLLPKVLTEEATAAPAPKNLLSQTAPAKATQALLPPSRVSAL